MIDHVALVIERDAKLLFVQRALSKKHLPGIWAFASGTVESNESFPEAAIRESQEEFGVKVKPLKILADHEMPEFGVRLHFVICEIIEGEPAVVAKDEFNKIAWMSLQDFFAKFSDEEIGHGLVWLRTHREAWTNQLG